jgi:uncharacterized protein YuzE
MIPKPTPSTFLSATERKIDRQEEAGPFIYDMDAEGRIVGVEILSASKVLAPDDWQDARRPTATSIDAVQ